MARTPTFTSARRALTLALAQVRKTPPAPRAISRRMALGWMAAGTAAACAPRSAVPGERGRRPVAIVGGGIAGLTIAWRLASAGRPVNIYESSGRTGGRMYTRRDLTAEGHFCELGGELVDSHHTALRALAGELGVELQRLRPEAGPDGAGVTDAYYFGGQLRQARDLLDPAAGTGAFLPIARRIAADQADLLDADEDWTPRARELDATPLSNYLAAMRDEAPAWALDFLAAAYHGEYGLPVEQQSALNLVDFISTDEEEPFEVFGDSDEAWRIAGGSSSLPDALAARLADPSLSGLAGVRLRHALTAIARDADGFTLTFQSPDGETAVGADAVVLTLPFTRLRTVAGLGGLGLPAEKMQAINELGHGVNSKLMVATRSRPWTRGAVLGTGTAFSGTIYSDLPMQMVWDTSAGQPGTGGVLTNFLSGDPALGEEAPALAALTEGLALISQQIADSLDPETRASFFWPRHPHTLASYSATAVAQYTRFPEVCGAPEFEGALQFAGEHTSVDFQGFMNGAIESAERVAAGLLARD